MSVEQLKKEVAHRWSRPTDDKEKICYGHCSSEVTESQEEEWRAVSGYEGIYEVSDLGRVRSYRRGKWGIGDKPKILSSDMGQYFGIALCKDGNKKVRYVHQIVAETFIPNPRNLTEVNHIDGNKRNNKVENLEWCTHGENMQHAADHGLFKSVQRKVVCEDTGEVFVSITAAAKSVGGSQSTLNTYLLYGTGEYKGRKFRFLEE